MSRMVKRSDSRKATIPRPIRRRPTQPQSGWSKFASGAGKALSMASTALTLAKGVAALVNVERKYVDYNVTAQAISNAGVVLYLSGIVQGDTATSRDGDSIRSKSLFHRCEFLTTAGTPAVVRCLVFVDTQNAGALPAVTDVLQTASRLSPLSMTNSKRFIVLQDELIDLNNPVTAAGMYKTMKFYKKTDFHIKYRDTTSSVTGANNNGIFCLYISNIAAGATTPSVSFSNRIRFIDN